MDKNDQISELTPNKRDAIAALEWLHALFEHKASQLDTAIQNTLDAIPPEPEWWQWISRQLYEDAQEEYQALDYRRREFLDVADDIQQILSIWKDEGEIDIELVGYLIDDLVDDWADRFDRVEVLDVYYNIARLKPFDLKSAGD